MKLFPLVWAVTVLGFLARSSCTATIIGISTVEQPVNLGSKSDPARIPLGRIGVVNNHGYGIQLMIGEARSCPDGAMRWEGGSELNQNLASVFGISVETPDTTQITAFPVTLRVKSWKPPGYSPYTKEQVLAATLWCLIRSTGGTPENPLDVRVVADGADDKPLEAKYSVKYVTRPGKDEKEASPVKVAGTVLEEDPRGITWVVFPEVTRKAPSIPPSPGMIVLANAGDGDEGWHILPVWGNGDGENDFLRLNGWSAAMCYSTWQSRGPTEANSFLAEGGANGFTVERGENFDSVSLDYPGVPQATLAANILALVISAQPTETRPLTVSFRFDGSDIDHYADFRNAPGWKETRQDSIHSDTIELKCGFVWDSAARKLTQGSIPLVRLEKTGGWISAIPVSEPADDPGAPDLAARVRSQIMEGFQDGSLLAEKTLAADMLQDSLQEREIRKAGYYQALATYSEGSTLPDKSQEDPLKLADALLLRAHHAGWMIGLARAEAIAIEARKAAEAEKPARAE